MNEQNYPTAPPTFPKDYGGDMEATPYPTQDGVYRCKAVPLQKAAWGIARLSGDNVEWGAEGGEPCMFGPPQMFAIWGEKIG